MNLLLLFLCLGLAEGLTEQYHYGSGTSGRHDFWRNMDQNLIENRRVFGGQPANLQDFPAIAALMDRYWNIRCSGSVISSFWAITAAHCVTSRLTYVLYNARRPFATEGDYTAILYLYRHPNYEVKQEDIGRGMDVTLLHHDLGLIRTRNVMKLHTPVYYSIAGMRRFTPKDLEKKEVIVMGFGLREVSTRRSVEELFSVKLDMVPCNVDSWYHCICGIGTKNSLRGVCSGDSGGPVVYQGVQVGVTSMGPIECATTRTELDEGATSVFTSLSQYADLINTTILETEKTIEEEERNLRLSIQNYSHRLIPSKNIIFLTNILFLATFFVTSFLKYCF